MSGELSAALERCGVLAILRLRDHGLAVEVGEALLRGGVEAVELTQDDPGAAAALRLMRERLPAELAVGAGTVLDAETVARVADAGASFCVSPNVDTAVIAAAHEARLAMVPGAATATEVARALAAEVAVVKLFPAGPLGIDYMRVLLGPFEDAALLPTGGIAPAAAGEWIAAGAVGVGVGGSLVSARPTEADLERIVERAAEAVAAVAEARGG